MRAAEPVESITTHLMRRVGSEFENRSYGSLISVLEIKRVILFFYVIMSTLELYYRHKRATEKERHPN